MTATVRDFLQGSPAAHVAASLDLGGGAAVAVWENRNDRISYQEPRGHVFSLYLQGGTGTRRLDGGPATGRPGTVCIMPQGQSSEWEITTQFRFVHLYLPDDHLRAAFATVHDCDARRLDLPEATFAEMPSLVSPLRALSQAAWHGDTLIADMALAELVGHLGSRKVALRGGLPAHILRRIDEWIDARLDGPILLADLAENADLSPFHLHRMFCASRGMTLHKWITRQRIKRAKALLATSTPLIEIAVACGFSNQSHFTRVFKAATTITPDAYRRCVSRR